MPKSRIDQLKYRLQARMGAFPGRERALFALLKRELDERCYVSFSAGKDSAVIAHACHAVRPGIPILMVDPGCPVHWLQDERDHWIYHAAFHRWNFQRFEWDKFSAAPRSGDLKDYREKVHKDMFADLTEHAEANGFTRRVMGLRAQESPERRMSLGRDKGLSEKRICPISLWTHDDVWCYIIKHRLPYLSIYDHLGPAARNGLIGRNGAAHGRLVYLKQFYPEAFRLARELLPEARNV